MSDFLMLMKLPQGAWTIRKVWTDVEFEDIKQEYRAEIPLLPPQVTFKVVQLTEVVRERTK